MLLPAVLLFLTITLPIEGQENTLSGPLYGKNYYLPHLPVYSFPGFSPGEGKRGDLALSLALTGYNEFTATDIENRVLDYEGSAFDFSFNWRPRKDLLIGVDSRIISYYGGLFDPVIEGWHNFFGFPNGGREYFSEYEVYAYIDNGSGRDINLSHPLAGLGDMDFYGIWTIYSEPPLTMAAAGAVKLPTGSLSSGTGSNFIDLGCQFLGSWEFHPRWMVHFQQGLVLPGDLLASGGDSYASFVSSQTFLAVQFMPRHDWSIILQTRINTSPLFSDQIRYTALWGASPLFTMAQTSLQAGFKKAWDSWALQVHIEEDPLTYEGLDILFSVKISRFFYH